MKARVFTLILVLLPLLSFAAGNSYASTLTVTKTADTNDGVCDADCSLAGGSKYVLQSGDSVAFSPLFNSPQTITLTAGQITIDKNLTITGTGRDLVTISGNNASRIFFISGVEVTVNLSGMTFRDGNDSGEGLGGAIRVSDSSIIVSNVTFTNNKALNSQCSCGAGGAIWGTENSSFTLSHLVVVGNFSPQGRAISGGAWTTIQDSVIKQNTGGGINSTNLNISRCVISDHNAGGVEGLHLTIVDSTITNNSTLGGVADGDASSTISIERCLISGNSRIRPGGGVLSSGMTIIKDTQITDNTAVSGGGGIANIGTLYLFNSAVSGNRSMSTGFEDGGGGIFSAIGRVYVINSTVSGNTASGNPGFGGGIYDLVNSANPGGRVYFVNSTIANNTSAGAGGGIRIDPNGEGDFSNSIIAGNNSTGTSAGGRIRNDNVEWDKPYREHYGKFRLDRGRSVECRSDARAAGK